VVFAAREDGEGIDKSFAEGIISPLLIIKGIFRYILKLIL